MKGFRQIRTDDLELMQVQDNVRDALVAVTNSIESLQFSFWSPGQNNDLANGIEADLPNKINLEKGSYIGLAVNRPRVNWSGAPTFSNFIVRIQNDSTRSPLIENAFAISNYDSSSSRSSGTTLFRITNWQGGLIKMRVRINVSGGSGITRLSQGNFGFFVRTA